MVNLWTEKFKDEFKCLVQTFKAGKEFNYCQQEQLSAVE